MTETEFEIDAAFAREARVGLSVVAILLCAFFAVAWMKYSGWNRPAPVPFTAAANNPAENGAQTPDALAGPDQAISDSSAQTQPRRKPGTPVLLKLPR